jgi:HAD superfamily hydrolase (TIGR01509 family)
MIEWLGAQGVAIVIATSAEAAEVTGLLKAAGVDDLIDQVASSDDATASKPDPDIVNAALKTSGQPRERAFMVGDTPYDIQAAGAAGILTVALRTGGWTDQDLAGAAAVFDDPEDFVRQGALTALRRA